MIQSREALVVALVDAAELEHNLACLYLFTAFTLKQDPTEGLSDEQLDLVTGWKGDILRVAQQEMGHLATVCNLLTVVGGAPHLRRPNFPQPLGYYPFTNEVKLEAFGKTSLDRFILFEEPEDSLKFAAEIVPPPLEYKTVGDLYRQISDAFATIDEAALFVRKDAPLDADAWGGQVIPIAPIDRKSALEAIAQIIKEGEAPTTTGPESHYRTFKRIRDELTAELVKSPNFEPARKVIENPLTRVHRDSPGKTVIDDPTTLAVAELFNACYITMILMLAQFYSFAGETTNQRAVLRQQIKMIMKGVIRPLGEALTRIPMGKSHPGWMAGPSFEFYGHLQFTTDVKACWSMLIERLAAESDEAGRLSQQPNAQPALKAVSQKLANIKQSLEQAK